MFINSRNQPFNLIIIFTVFSNIIKGKSAKLVAMGDIREIKHRLNRAIIIYETLLSRFPDKEKEIDFDKCAVASYIMCAYETDFNKTDDDFFDTIVELNMQKKLVDFHLVKEKLNTENEDYSKDIWTLVLAKLITADYRMYFYNYPQGSDIYTNDENAIINAILYDEYSDNLIIKKTHSDIFGVYMTIEYFYNEYNDLEKVCNKLISGVLQYYTIYTYDDIN